MGEDVGVRTRSRGLVRIRAAAGSPANLPHPQRRTHELGRELLHLRAEREELLERKDKWAAALAAVEGAPAGEKKTWLFSSDAFVRMPRGTALSTMASDLEQVERLLVENKQATDERQDELLRLRYRMCIQCDTLSAHCRRCGRCKEVWYCTPLCQKVHWREHKATCKEQA